MFEADPIACETDSLRFGVIQKRTPVLRRELGLRWHTLHGSSFLLFPTKPCFRKYRNSSSDITRGTQLYLGALSRCLDCEDVDGLLERVKNHDVRLSLDYHPCTAIVPLMTKNVIAPGQKQRP